MNKESTEKAPKKGEEIKSTGSVKLAVYNEYIKSGAGPLLRFILVFSHIATQAFFSGSDFWLTGW